MYLYIDLETRSSVDLLTHGAERYFASSDAALILASYALGDARGKIGEVKTVWKPGTENPWPSEILEAKKFVAHNYFFERCALRRFLPIASSVGIAALDSDNFICSAQVARRWGLPGSLDATAVALGIGAKDPEGKRLIARYSKPDRNGQFREIIDEDRTLWIEYGKRDVELMARILAVLPPLEDAEAEAAWVDRRINCRGFRVDREALEKINTLYVQSIAKLEEHAAEAFGRETSGALTLTSSVGFLRWLRVRGAKLSSVSRAALAKAGLKGDVVSAEVQAAIEMRTLLAASAPKKLRSLLDRHYAGYVRDSLLYAGAHTLRWSGRGVQPQNFQRSCVPEGDFAAELRALPEQAPAEIVAKAGRFLRPLVIAGERNTLGVADYSAIEARVVFWLAGCKRGLDQYREGRDLYVEFAQRLNLKGIDPVTARQIGKTCILGLGYGMGAVKLAEQLRSAVGRLDPSLAERCVRAYRRDYPEVPALWQALESGWQNVGKVNSYLRYEKRPKAIWLWLPSGRPISYFRASPKDLTFLHPQRGLKTVYGGLLAENVTQAVARDLMRDALIETEKARLRPVLTVHDEIVCDFFDEPQKRKQFADIMQAVPVWAEGLPIAAEIKFSKRWGK